jgi:beta-glucanase (GH16 family)
VKPNVNKNPCHLVVRTLLTGLTLILAACGAATSTHAESLPGWSLVWSDEFSQADGSSPDPTKWNHDIGTGRNGWGNKEWQYYTARPENARIEDGMLIIEAHKEPYEGQDYTSARLHTKGLGEWKHGRIEARIQLPRGQGIWPAFWMLGNDFKEVGWPRCGEIDIMENVGKEPRVVHGTVHGPGYSGGKGVGGSHTHDADLADDFHVYAVEWDPNVIRWFFNGKEFFSVTPDDIKGKKWVYEHPHFILLNMAVGGLWPGYPDETTVFPQRMRVDYVRVYARESTADSSGDGKPASD